MKRNLYIGSTLAVLLVAFGIAASVLQKTADAQSKGAGRPPRCEVARMGPKPLPNGWYLGQTIGVGIDAQDHVWIIHRSDSLDQVEAAADEEAGTCCKKAPPALV